MSADATTFEWAIHWTESGVAGDVEFCDTETEARDTAARHSYWGPVLMRRTVTPQRVEPVVTTRYSTHSPEPEGFDPTGEPYYCSHAVIVTNDAGDQEPDHCDCQIGRDH